MLFFRAGGLKPTCVPSWDPFARANFVWTVAILAIWKSQSACSSGQRRKQMPSKRSLTSSLTHSNELCTGTEIRRPTARNRASFCSWPNPPSRSGGPPPPDPSICALDRPDTLPTRYPIHTKGDPAGRGRTWSPPQRSKPDSDAYRSENRNALDLTAALAPVLSEQWPGVHTNTPRNAARIFPTRGTSRPSRSSTS